MATERKNIANRKNSEQSSGPRTLTGKKHSSRNAVKHGFFSRNPSLSDGEKEEFENLVAQLDKDLSPKTTLESLALRDIAWCMWRCRVALVLEARSTEALMEQTEKTETVVSESPVKPAAFYSESAFDLRTGISWMKTVLEDFHKNQIVREEWKPTFELLFGPRFYSSLTEWKYVDVLDVLLANMMRTKANNYNMQLPEGLRGYEKQPLIGDPLQKQHLTEKLLEFQLRHMQEFLSTWQQRADPNSAANPRIVDFSPRYHSSAVRDLHRAIGWFFRLKELEGTV